MARLNHPNIMKMIDMGEVKDDNGQTMVLLLLPLCPRGSLLGEIQWRRQSKVWFPEHEMLTLFQAICQAVGYMHACQPSLAHRDLKVGDARLIPSMTLF